MRLGVDGALAIQTEKTQRLDESVGGVAEVTMADGAALCAGMHEKHYMAVRLVDMLDSSVAHYITMKLWAEAMEISQREKWRGNVARGTGEHDKPRKLADLVVMEALAPARFATADGWNIRADYLGVSKSKYFETWKPRYEAVYMKLAVWVDCGRNYLRTQCKKNNAE